MSALLKGLSFILASIILLNVPLYAQETYMVQKAILTVYRDGVVHANITLLVDEYEPLITLPLLSPRVSNVMVVDEGGSPLEYDLSVGNITIYSLGSTSITLEYDTDGITYKELGLWTINFTAPFELTLILPENATIMYISNPLAILAIRAVGSRLEVDLSPGYWEISYEIPLQPPTPPPPPTHPPLRVTWIPVIGYIAAAAVIICAATITILYLRRRRIEEALGDEEAEVVRFIRDKGGRVLEAELRENFPHIPRTSMWRLVKRLEKRGVVRVKKVGLQNVVELK
ncbi:MAG: hypothetical protein N3E47_05200 [Candidatus Bathyarchaeota archaeon]|nr:hypothetical protein [Candidatus Bathyarchaeota archaeon]